MVKTATSLLFFSLLIIGTCGSLQAQEITIKGTVTNAQTGEPISNVNIIVRGTNLGTSTSANGQYSLQVPSLQDTLVFSFVGYESQVVPIGGRTSIDVSLEPTTYTNLQELVVVGYGTQQRSDLTGAISTVDAEEVQKIPTSSLMSALQGKVAGVQITPSSGAPGSAPVVHIRGIGTLNNASPLYVVDGMILDDIAFLSPNNVESIQVLKDASATAIYGARGANGVIIITTEEGRAGTSRIGFNAYMGFQHVVNKVDMVNAHQYAILANESAANENRPRVFENPDQYGVGTNWQQVVMDKLAPQQNYQITASGGADNVTYFVSGNYFNQEGVMRGSDFRRLSLRINSQYFISDFIDFGQNLLISYEELTNAVGNLAQLALRADPTTDPREPDGDFANTMVNGGTANPAAAIYYNRNDNFGFRTMGNLYLNINFTEHLRFHSNLGIDLERNETKVFNPKYFVSTIQQSNQSSLTAQMETLSTWLFENTFHYNRDIGEHRIELLAGITFQKFRYEILGGHRINILSPDREFWFLNAGAEDGQTNFNSSRAWGIISYLFRANYSYKNKYYFTATYRIDGSSRFAENNRYGGFPSLAVAWQISDEPFLSDSQTLSNLKLRASWGIIGNDKISPYGQYAIIVSNVNAIFGVQQTLHRGATQQGLGNPALTWEETEQFDVGLEVGFFEQRLTAQIDWYRRVTSDILITVPIPDYIGAGDPFVNAASVLNTGLDMALTFRGSGEDFNYSIGLVGSTVHNEVLKLGQGKEEILGGSVRQMSFTTRTVPGQPIGAFFGYEVIGIWQTQEMINSNPHLAGVVPGDLRFADLNGDGNIDTADRTFLGSPTPAFNFGINLSGTYKQFDLSISFDGRAGNKVLYARPALRGFRLINYDTFYLRSWTGPGTSTTVPRITETGHNYTEGRFLYDGGYIRLRNVQLGYTLPPTLSDKLGVRNLRVYVNANNVFILTDYPGYTPLVAGDSVIARGIDTGGYPLSSVYTAGIQIDF